MNKHHLPFILTAAGIKKAFFLATTGCIMISWLSSCKPTKMLDLPFASPHAMSGSSFYLQVQDSGWKYREQMLQKEILSGNIPSFLRKMVPIKTTITDSTTGKKMQALYYVTADYISIGNDHDFARTPMTPMTAQIIADSLHCFLPTRKIVNNIYEHARVKLTPHPMTLKRDSAATFYEHHLIIESQRKGRKGLIAGIKKDVVISNKISADSKPNRVAIYGWHQPDGKPIQPLYTGHVNWYVDYSHGIRLVYNTIWIDGRPMDYREVLQDSKLASILSDEPQLHFYRY